MHKVSANVKSSRHFQNRNNDIIF